MLERIPDLFFDYYWAAWLLIGFGLFEAIALVRDAGGDTLSDKVREWFGTNTKPKGPMVMARRFALIAGLAWLVVHWLTDGTFV